MNGHVGKSCPHSLAATSSNRLRMRHGLYHIESENSHPSLFKRESLCACARQQADLQRMGEDQAAVCQEGEKEKAEIILF